MSSISRSASMTFLTQIPTQILGIISGIFITRMLGPEGKGDYAIFYADISLFITILGFSLSTAIIQFKASKRMSHAKLMSITVLFSLVTIVLSGVLLFFWLNSSYGKFLFPDGYINQTYIIWFMCFLLITQVNTVYSSFFQGARKFHIVNRVLLVNSIVNILLYSSAFILNSYGIFQIGLLEILMLALGVLVFNTLQWHFHFRKHFTYEFNFKISWKNDIRSFFSFTGLGHLSNIVNFFNYRLALWVIEYYMDTAQVGIFSLAAGLSQLLYFISTPLSQVLMPFLSAENEKDRKAMFIRFSRVHFTSILIVAAGAAVTAPFLIPWLYGTEFTASVVAFELLLLGIIVSCQTKIFASYFVADNRMHLNLIATLVGFALTFSFNFILIRSMGVNGASIAQSITYMGIFLFVYFALITFAKVGKLNLFITTQEDIAYARKKLQRKSRKSS